MTVTAQRIRGIHVLFGMLAFFGLVIAVNVTFVVFALDTFPGEDVRRSYLQGLNYNETLAERRAQALQGWQAQAELTGAASNAELRVVLRDAQGAPLNGATLTGDLRWPANERLDRTLTFEPRGAGVYAASLGALHQGRWTLRARAEDDHDGALDFQAELTWPSTR